MLYGLSTLLYGLTLAGTAYVHHKNSTAVEIALENIQESEMDPTLHTNGIVTNLEN